MTNSKLPIILIILMHKFELVRVTYPNKYGMLENIQI